MEIDTRGTTETKSYNCAQIQGKSFGGTDACLPDSGKSFPISGIGKGAWIQDYEKYEDFIWYAACIEGLPLLP